MECFCDTGKRLIERYIASMWDDPNKIKDIWRMSVSEHLITCEVCAKHAIFVLYNPGSL